jgi:hypothetical protein
MSFDEIQNLSLSDVVSRKKSILDKLETDASRYSEVGAAICVIFALLSEPSIGGVEQSQTLW